MLLLLHILYYIYIRICYRKLLLHISIPAAIHTGSVVDIYIYIIIIITY